MTIPLLIIHYRMVGAYSGDEVGIILWNILGLTTPQATLLSNNGWQMISDFEDYSTDDIKEYITNSSGEPANRGAVVIPPVRGKRIMALAYGVNHLTLHGLVPDHNEFLAPQIRQELLDYPFYDYFIKADNTADKPEQLTIKNGLIDRIV